MKNGFTAVFLILGEVRNRNKNKNVNSPFNGLKLSYVVGSAKNSSSFGSLWLFDPAQAAAGNVERQLAMDNAGISVVVVVIVVVVCTDVVVANVGDVAGFVIADILV